MNFLVLSVGWNNLSNDFIVCLQGFNVYMILRSKTKENVGTFSKQR